MRQNESNAPAYFERRWVRCVQCLKTYMVKTPYRLAESRCCAAPLRSRLWHGWGVRDAEPRAALARGENARSRIRERDRRREREILA